MKNYLPILALLAIVAVFFGWRYLAPVSAPDDVDTLPPLEESTLPTEPAVTIAFTDEGFVPREVFIKRGDIVRFTNESKTLESWPASAVHPTHSIYPEKTKGDCLGSAFDACRGLKPGESWDFRFTEVGEWRFHDHIHASKTGVVTVSQ